MKNVNGKRPAIRVGETEAEANAFAVERYGAMKEETMNQIVAWLKTKGDLYKWEIETEYINGLPHPILKTQMKGSFVFKITDNEHDAQNTLANILARP